MNIQKITIAGAGTMGHSMAQIFARYHFDVTLYNHREPTLQKARQKIRENTDTMVQQGELSAEEADALTGRLSYTTDMDTFRESDLIIENIAENMDVKLAFYHQMSPLARPDAIIATNTSGLSINALAKAVTHPDRFLGMHWFNPPHLIPLIEIIKNDATRQDVADAIYDLSLKIDKKPAIVEKDVPGFAANRIQLAILRETLDLVSKGVISKEGADAVMKYGLGFRYACLGPLETVDFGGIDTFHHIADYLMPDLCDSHDIPALLDKAYQNGDYGVKTGKGFYDYSDGRDVEATAERDRKLLAVYHALYGKK